MPSRHQIVSSICLVLICVCVQASHQPAVTLQAGDLLFQDTNCGTFCDNVDSVTLGYGQRKVSHMGMVLTTKPTVQVIEARSAGVVVTPLALFLQRSLDDKQHPRVMVGRLIPKYRPLIPQAIASAKAQIGKPYNSSFIPNHGTSFYCSELIAYAFTQANHGQPLFKSAPMNFKAPGSESISLAWHNYYANLGVAVPQGQAGTNPGAISRAPQIKIIYIYGDLRQH